MCIILYAHGKHWIFICSLYVDSLEIFSNSISVLSFPLMLLDFKAHTERVSITRFFGVAIMQIKTATILFHCLIFNYDLLSAFIHLLKFMFLALCRSLFIRLNLSSLHGSISESEEF